MQTRSASFGTPILVRQTSIGVGTAIALDPLLGPGPALISASGSYLGWVAWQAFSTKATCSSSRNCKDPAIIKSRSERFVPRDSRTTRLRNKNKLTSRISLHATTSR